MIITGLLITALAGAAILAIGALYLLRPRAMSASFGLPDHPPPAATPWLRVKGIRDLVTGLVAAALLITAPPTVIGWSVCAFSVIPLGDGATVLAYGGNPRIAWGVHFATAALMLVGVVLLISS